MKLWSAEIEALRPETREAVASGFDTINDMIGTAGPYPDGPLERAGVARKQFERIYAPLARRRGTNDRRRPVPPVSY